MHVSLHRRYHRVGHAMPYLLWLGVGVLAVIPWQVLCGQDQPAKSIVERTVDDQIPERDVATDDASQEDAASPKQSQPDQSSDPKSSSPSLIFRGQAPMEMSPLQMSPQQMGPPGSGPEMEDTGFLSSDLFTGRSGQALGNFFRVGGFTGPAIGRKVSIFPIEWMPYSLIDNNLFFADIRAFRGSTDTWGANFGGGYRRYVPMVDRIFGVNAFFDYDNTSGATFRQVGFGLESLGALYDVRANAYLPTGVSAQQLSLVNVDGTQQFVGHNLLVNQQRTIANSLHGFDGEIGVPIPGPIPQRHDLRVFGGGYWYEGSEISAFGGWKTRVQANVIPSIAIQLEISHDQQFKTNVVFGGSWSYGGFKQSPGERKTQYNRMTTPVIRNYNMIVGITDKFDLNVPVINPTTNLPYFFEHVDSNATSPGDGTVEHPFTVFGSAQNSTAHDIIFVHANSVFNGVGVALEENVRVLGEASTIDHAVATLAQNSTSSLGNLLLLPHPTPIPTGSTSTLRPLFAQAPGDGVILANNSEFSGFRIGNINNPLSGPVGRGIVGQGIRDVFVRQTDVSYSGAEAVLLNNTLGNIVFRGDTINDPIGSATTFSVTGTAGSILFTSDPLSSTRNSAGAVVPTPGVINNVLGNGGRALLVDGTLAGSTVDFTDSTINDTNGLGLLIQNDSGTVTLGNANVINSQGIGLNILNDSGLISSRGTITINGSTGDSLVIENLAAGGSVQFLGTGSTAFDVNILNRLARGIYLNNNAGNVVFSTGASVAAAGPVDLAAIDYQASSGNVTFNNIRINGGGPGILIGTTAVDGTGAAIDSTGRFAVNGSTAITNAAGIGIQVIDDLSTVTFNSALNSATTTIDQRGNIGIQVLSNKGAVTFNGTTTITNANLVTRPAVDIRGNTDLRGSVRFNALNVQNAFGPPADPQFGGVGVNIGGVNAVDFNPAAVTFNLLNIGNLQPAINGTALYVRNEGQRTGATPTGLTIGAGTIDAVGGRAVDIQDSGINVRLTSVSSIASATIVPDFGINLVNDRLINDPNPPVLDNFMFTVGTTTDTSQITGGTISSASIAAINLAQTDAALLQTGAVSINNMSLLGNAIGIRADSLLQLNVTNSNISNNVGNGSLTDTGTGIDAADLPRVDIQSSLFNLNGSTLRDHAIYLHTTTPLLQPPQSVASPTNGRYLWNISNNTNLGGFFGGFTGAFGTGDLVRIAGSGPGGGDLQVTQNTIPIQTFAVPLVFQFENNSMLVHAGTTTFLPGVAANPTVAGVGVLWTGQIDTASTVTNLTSSISNNTINLTGNDIGIGIQNASNRYTTNFVIDGNIVTANNGGNVGLFVNNFSQTNLDIGTGNGNIFTFITPAGTGAGTPTDFGMAISVTNSTNNTSLIEISDNTITMAGGTLNQAILFPNMQAPAIFTINNNLITITGALPIIGQGIDFQIISKPTVVLRGNVSNTILINGNGAGITSQNWFNRQPLNSTSGQIIINGFTGP